MHNHLNSERVGVPLARDAAYGELCARERVVVWIWRFPRTASPTILKLRQASPSPAFSMTHDQVVVQERQRGLDSINLTPNETPDRILHQILENGPVKHHLYHALEVDVEHIDRVVQGT